MFFLDDFAGLGTPDAVKKSLQRLINSNFLVRLAYKVNVEEIS
ncbi:MAG: DUF6088 family protein [Culturomica sp.]|nr:DUF6088 family protein [Culturomica sp.]